MSEPVMVGGTPTAPSNRRALIMLGVAVLVAVLALVLPKVLFGGGDTADDFDDLAGPTVTRPTPLAVEADDGIVADPARTFEVFSTKNPFTPLIDTTPVVAIAPAAPGTVAAGVAPAVAADGTVAPAVPVAPEPETSSATPAGGVAAEPTISQRVALLEVFVDAGGSTVGSVRVDNTVHEVAEGAAFATGYRAVTLSVADGCGQFLHGSAPFRLCEGEELLK